MSSPRTEIPPARRAVRWLLPAALLALVPKCLLCVAAYAGLGAALGLGGREICGASANVPGSWLSWLLLPGGVLGVFGFFARSAHWSRSVRRTD